MIDRKALRSLKGANTLAAFGLTLLLAACGGTGTSATSQQTESADLPTLSEPASPETQPKGEPDGETSDLSGEMTLEQENAVETALSYVEYSAFSRSGLIDQLEYEGFSSSDAKFAVDRIDADWNEQAAKSAASYLEFSSFSRSGLAEQLEYDGYTSSQAEYGVDQAFGGQGGGSSNGNDGGGSGGSVSRQNAVDSAISYLDYSPFSRSGLIEQLEYEGYSSSDATYAVDSIEVNWNEQAAKSAANYLEFSSFSRSGLIDQLKYEGFTQSQAEYGVSQTGL